MPLSGEERLLLKTIYNRLDENKPLKPEDPDYHEIYQPVYDHPGCDDPVELMQTRIDFSNIESVQLFSGFRGSGKTTELYRLKKRLEDEGYVVLYADALEYVSQSEEVDISNLLIVLAGAFGDAMKEQLKIDVTGENYWTRFTNYLTRTTVSVSEATVKAEGDSPFKELIGGLKAGIDLKASLKTSPSFRQTMEKALANRIGELKDHVDKFIEDGVKAIREKVKDQKGIVFLFDSLEQVRGTRLNEQSVIRSVERLFADYFPKMLRLPYVHAIYTVPPWLQFSNPNITKIVIIPCVRQWHNDDGRSEYKDGCNALYSLVMRRFGEAGFKRFFGESAEPQNPLARRVLDHCGGHFRDLLYMLREALLRAKSLPVLPEVIETAIAEMRGHFLPIAVEDARWLHQIANHRSAALPDSGAESVNRLTKFLDTHFVLYFKNGDEWYDIHPLIREEVAEIIKNHTPSPGLVPVAPPSSAVPVTQ
ncbi:MAG TPA: hypothetical protein VGB07_29410 [Blastocatellia bacterium]